MTTQRKTYEVAIRPFGDLRIEVRAKDESEARRLATMQARASLARKILACILVPWSVIEKTSENS